MQRERISEGRFSASFHRWTAWTSHVVIVGVAVCCLASTAGAQEGFDNPFDHPLEFDAPMVGTHDTTYGPEALQWTAATRVFAIQSIGRNWDVIVNSDFTFVSQYQRVDDVDFVLFDGSTLENDGRAAVPTTATVYSGGGGGGPFYANYVRATPFDEWDGENGFANFNMLYYDLAKAKTLYLKAGVAYRFDVDREDGNQSGFAALMRTDPSTRIQPRSQAVAEFSWDGPHHDDFVFAPEEGLYTLVVIQKNGHAAALGTVLNTQLIPRGISRVSQDKGNSIRINVSAE